MPDINPRNGNGTKKKKNKEGKEQWWSRVQMTIPQLIYYYCLNIYFHKFGEIFLTLQSNTRGDFFSWSLT
jgi:hypothetical protein